MFVAGSAHLADVPAMVERFQEWGVPLPTFNVYLSGLTEIVCGLLLLVGFASRLISIPLIVNFCVAYLTASREVLLNVFSDPDAFVSDAAFLFLLASLIVFILWAGCFVGRRPYQEVLGKVAADGFGSDRGDSTSSTARPEQSAVNRWTRDVPDRRRSGA